MVGSGIFLLPAALAQYGILSLVGWLISAAGGLVVAKVFADLAKRFPRSGGPYEYSKQGFGDFVGFLVAWGYWIAIVTTNAAIVVTMISYLSVFFPALATKPLLAIVVGLTAIWFLTFINCKGIKDAAWLQLTTTILKLIPLIAVGIVGLFFINIDHFSTINLSEESNFSAIMMATTLTLFAFLGVESATIPADNIEHPKVTIPKATMIGIVVTALVYILGTIAVMGIIPSETLPSSSAPFADAASVIWGDSARKWVSLGVIISTFGALNGWIMMQGQIPLAASNDAIFPRYFKHTNQKGLPVTALVFSSVIISALMLMNYSKSFIEAFKFMILLSTLTCLVPYLFSAATHLLFSLNQSKPFAWIWGSGAFVFSMWAIIGSGEEIVFWGFVTLMAGIPLYVLNKWSDI